MPRRFLIFGLVLIGLPLLVILIVLILKPADDLRPFRPHIQSEYVVYYEVAPGVMHRSRQITLQSMPFEQSVAALRQTYSKKPGWTFRAPNTEQSSSGGFANVFTRLDVEEWQGRPNTPIPDNERVPPGGPIYFMEAGIRIRDWRELLWARLTRSIRTMDPDTGKLH